MKASEKYRMVFGEIKDLAEAVPWTTGVSNMLEWLTWSTGHVLGTTKTRYRKTIVEWARLAESEALDLEATQKYVDAKLNDAMRESDKIHRYDKPTSKIASPREALRRAKYFSEDYLNKEFDIFWGLVSDAYLDEFYSQFTTVQKGGRWYTHGNSGLFANSVNIREMQMDNLAYNPSSELLVANELKLGGRKNPDQLLKYALMFKLLKERGFVVPDTRFVLLFIGDKPETGDWDAMLEEEVRYCRSSGKATAGIALACEGLARAAEYGSTTWGDLVAFNTAYRAGLDATSQQVECKLLEGFDQSLQAKAFMVPA